MGIHATRILSEGITGYEVRTTKLFGNTAGISAGSLYIDVDADIHAAKSLTGDREAEKRWFAATGMVSSLYESTIWEELTGEESVSTMTVLNTAREQGTEILVINDKNLDSETTRLDTDSATREAVTNAVHRGNTVIIPAQDVAMGDWHGTGYIVMDMETGAGAYMISGGLNGGAFPAAVTLEMLLGLICSAFSEAVLLASIVTMCGILSSATGLALAGWTAMYILSVASLVAIGMSTYYMVQQWQIYLVTGDEDAAEYVFRMGAMLGLGALVDALLIKITSKPKNPGGGQETGGGNNGGEDPGSGGGTGGDEPGTGGGTGEDGPGSGGGTGGDGPGSGGGTGGDDPGTGGSIGDSGLETLGVDVLKVRDKKFLDANGNIDWDTWAPNGGRVPGTIQEGQSLDVGTVIDRYGNVYGIYTSPVGTPYEQRALPYIENPNAYHQYEVLKPIDNVTISKVAKAFEQPGGGIQYELPTTIYQLMENGFLKEIIQ